MVTDSRFKYQGHQRDGTSVVGFASGSPSEFAQSKFNARWIDLTITRRGEEVGGIDSNTGTRMWWGESS